MRNEQTCRLLERQVCYSMAVDMIEFQIYNTYERMHIYRGDIVTKEHTECCDMLHAHREVVTHVEQTMPDENALFELSELFKTFGDPTRIRILFCLFIDEMCVCDIANLLQMSQSAISHQLAILKRQKLIKARRDGKAVFYALADDHVRTIINQGMDHVNE